MSRLLVAAMSVALFIVALYPFSQAIAQITWPDDQLLPTFRQPQELDVADIVYVRPDIKLMMATLQGVVNREQPRIYLLENTEEGRLTWLRDLKIPYEIRDHFDIVSTYKSEISGMIVYDPHVPDSINVATTLAGIHDAIVVSPLLAEQLSAEPFEIDIIDDLTGKFQDKLDAYQWQYDNLWEQTTDRMLIGLSPGRYVELPGAGEATFRIIAEETVEERNQGNRQIYELDLTSFLGREAVYLRFQDAFPQDGWGPAIHTVTVEANGEKIADFIAGTHDELPFLHDGGQSQTSSGFGGHRFADGNRQFIYRFTPPVGTETLVAKIDMWNQFKVSAGNQDPVGTVIIEPYGYLRDYAVANRAMVFWFDPNGPGERELFEEILSQVKPGTPYLGWFSDDIRGEFTGVEVTSAHGVYVLAADWFSNLTVFSGARPEDLDDNIVISEPTGTLENKIYVTYVVGEGDNLQYNQHRMRILWNDSLRGTVPINWTSSPLLYDSAPAILNYYHRTATPNDLLIAGPSGGGYFYPNAWPSDSFADFLQNHAHYLKKSGMPIPYVLNRTGGRNISLSPSVVRAYEEHYNMSGLFLSWDDHTHRVYVANNTTPISIIRGVGSVEDAVDVLMRAKDSWDGESPMFVSLGIFAWRLTPTDIFAITQQLGPEFEVVLADKYFALMREMFGLP